MSEVTKTTVFTSGPLEVRDLDRTDVQIYDATDNLLASMQPYGGIPEMRANAHLFAAAPELLRALRLWVNRYETLAETNPELGFEPEITIAREAIAKTRGTK